MPSNVLDYKLSCLFEVDQIAIVKPDLEIQGGIGLQVVLSDKFCPVYNLLVPQSNQVYVGP